MNPKVTRSIYEGPRSVYALREGMYAEGHGVDLRVGITDLYFLLRDLKRGWTYNKFGQRIPMDEELFKARARYLYPLCIRKMGHWSDQCRLLKEAIDYVIQYHRLPDWATSLISIGYTREKVPMTVPVVGVAPRMYRNRGVYAYAGAV